jgi:hypothetical protein
MEYINFIGLIISTIFTTEINAHQITMTIFYPILLLSGNDKVLDNRKVKHYLF